MRIGIRAQSYDQKSYSKFWGDKMYEKLKAHGYSCSDFGMSDTTTAIYTLPQAESDAFLLRERKMAEDAGITIWQTHGPWQWPPHDNTPEGRQERMEKMKKAIRATNVLGSKYCVIHPIMPFGINELHLPESKATFELNIEYYGELLQTAKEYDVTICYENMPMPNFSLATPADILRVVHTLNDEHFQVCLDLGHVTVYKSALNMGEEIHRLGSHIRVLHVHDGKGATDQHLLPQMGITDWGAVAQALKDIHFDGVFSLEADLPDRMPEPLFEDMCKLVARISKDIVKDL